MIDKVTIIFPGQGGQYVGMGKDLPSEYFDRASEEVGCDLRTLCLTGPAEALNLTINTQPAILAHSIASWQQLRPLLEAKGIAVARVLGHSVGEYAALVCAGALSFEDAVSSTRLRGKLMQEAVPLNQGGMVAILKLPGDLVERTCREVSTSRERVSVANFNSPEQVVISGHLEAMEKVVAALKKRSQQKFRALPLSVSAPFHSELMKPAAEGLKGHLEKLSFHPLEIPYVANIDGKEYPRKTLGEVVRNNLVRQVVGSVQWALSTRTLEENAVVVEVGPGQVLKGLVAKCRPDATCYSLENYRDGLDFIDHLGKKES